MNEKTEQKEKRMHPVLWFGMAALFTLGGIYLGFNVAKGLSAKKWTETKCQITRFDHTYSRKGRHHLSVGFNYVFNGQPFSSSSFGPSGNSTRDRDVLRQYSARQEAVCYVNPANPAQAVLQRELEFMDWVYPPGGVGLGILMIFAGLSESKRRRTEKEAVLPLPTPLPVDTAQESDKREAA